jgi:hypothetical protein
MQHSIKDQLSIELRSLFTGYPDFVYSKNNGSNLDGIPVFVYHTIEPKLFESQLQFLKENEYRTLAIKEFHEAIVNPRTSSNRKIILLTIDDARSSVWRFAYPLLQKYQMHATVFVIPGITEDSKSCRKNLEDVWNGKCELKEIQDSDINDNTLCSWQEIKEMYNSGFLNIESHTLFHREIFKNINITDYISPNISFVPYNFRGSPYFTINDVEKTFSAYDFIGLPLFESDPLMLAGPKLNITPEFVLKCKKIYQDHSKKSNEWKSAIKNIVNEPGNRKKYFNLESHSKPDVLEDLKIARELIQSRLDNTAGNHLCLPWTKGNGITVNICKELGIKSCFWGVLENKKIIKPGDDPFYISRIKNDFIFRLPGIGRKSFYSIYKSKMIRRLSGGKVF